VTPDRSNNFDVTPAKAEVHPEMIAHGAISGWIPAFAGMTSDVLKVR
jgi:hypothetical protein